MCVADDVNREFIVAGATSWQQKNRKAYGISMSLYDQHPITGKISGTCMYLSITDVASVLLDILGRDPVHQCRFLWTPQTADRVSRSVPTFGNMKDLNHWMVSLCHNILKTVKKIFGRPCVPRGRQISTYPCTVFFWFHFSKIYNWIYAYCLSV